MTKRVPLDIDNAAWLLIRKFGDECAVEAYRRARCCYCHSDHQAAVEWQAVLRKVVELHFAKPQGPKH